VSCDAGAESVLDEIVSAGEQAELTGCDDEVQVGRAGTHRAVALEQIEVGRRQNLDADAAAMAGACVPDRRGLVQVRGAFQGAAKSCDR